MNLLLPTELTQPGACPSPSYEETWGAIVVCGMPFDGEPPFSDTHLPRALARNRRVLVVERPLPVHRGARSLRARVVQIGERLWKFQPLALPGPDRPKLALLSDPLIARQVSRAADEVLGRSRVMITFAPARGLLPSVERQLTVYWRRDAAANANYVTSVRHEEARHEQLLRRADLVVAVSPPLLADSAAHNARSVLLPNGADVEHFAEPSSALLPDLGPGPVIGYLGAVSWRLDVDLVGALATARPDWQFVLAGEVSVDLPTLPNLHAVGPQPWSQMPAWAHRFDVGIVPYLIESFNRSSFPLKVFDYLASGRPVVSTPLPGLEGLEPCVQLAEGVDTFVKATEAALAGVATPDACRTLAAANSWDHRAEALAAILDERLALTAS